MNAPVIGKKKINYIKEEKKYIWPVLALSTLESSQ